MLSRSYPAFALTGIPSLDHHNAVVRIAAGTQLLSYRIDNTAYLLLHHSRLPRRIPPLGIRAARRPGLHRSSHNLPYAH